MDKYDTLEYSRVKCYNDILCTCGIIYLSIRNINKDYGGAEQKSILMIAHLLLIEDLKRRCAIIKVLSCSESCTTSTRLQPRRTRMRKSVSILKD